MKKQLKDMMVNERPHERMASVGPGGLSDVELLAILLRKGTRSCDVMDLAHRLLRSAGSLHGLLNLGQTDFTALPGIGLVKAQQLLAHVEVARRMLRPSETVPMLDAPSKVFQWLFPTAEGMSVEKFWVLSLNRKNRLIHCKAVTSGTATASLVHPREVFREAIRNAATAIICAHNHPSGDPAPSQADIRVTRQLVKAADTVQIDLHDHVILGSEQCDPLGIGYFSFAEQGML